MLHNRTCTLRVGWMVGGEYEMDRESWDYEFGLKDFKSWIEGLN